MSHRLKRKEYPSDVSDEEWAFAKPYLSLLPEKSGQRGYALREVFNGLRYVVRSGCPWRWMPGDLPAWEAVYQQARRWLAAGVFEAMCHDLRALLRVAQGRKARPSAAILDARTVQSTPESGARAGFDGHKKRKGSKTHVAVDTLGHLLALHVTPANEQERDQVGVLAQAAQEATGDNLTHAFADQGYTGEKPAKEAKEKGLDLEVVKLPEAKNGFVLLPKRWVVERSFGWLARCRRLARDYERLPNVFAGLHFVAFVGLLLARLTTSCLVSS